MNPMTRKTAKFAWVALLAVGLYVSSPAVKACGTPPGNPSCSNNQTSQSSPTPSTGVGNPIDVLTGNKYQEETDFEIPGDLSIGLRRHYNSLATQTGVLGLGWTHTYETSLSRTESRGLAPANARLLTIIVMQADGRPVRFQPYSEDANVRRYRSSPRGYGVIEEDLSAIERIRGGNGSGSANLLDQTAVWKWSWQDGRILTFNGRGLLKTVEAADGRSLTLQFDAERRLARVTDTYGNWLAAAYWDDSAERLQAFDADAKATAHSGGYRHRLKSVSLSTGEEVRYQYDAHGNLSDVVYPDGTSRRYKYARVGDRDYLTQIYGRDGRLFSSYAYEASGRATNSTHPDHRDDVSVSYQWPTGKQTIGHTLVTDSLGHQTTYTWRADPLAESPVLLSASGPGCRTCSAGNVRYEYDSSGKVTKTSFVDDAGVVVQRATSEVDDLGRQVRLQIESMVNGNVQTPVWHESREYEGNNMRPSVIVRPSVVPGKEHVVRVTYNVRGQPLIIAEQGFAFNEAPGPMAVSLDTVRSIPIERVTALTYRQVHGMSLLGTVDGPLPGSDDTWTFQYDAVGQLTTIAHPMGAVENFTRDPWGRIKTHTDLDGVRDVFDYAWNGDITHFSHGDPWMSLSYGDSGRISKVLDSLGQQLTLTRNERGELDRITDVENNRIQWRYGDHGEVRDFSLLDPDGTLSQHGHLMTASAIGGDNADRYSAVRDESMLSSLSGALPDEFATAIPQWNETEARLGLRTVYGADRRATSYVYDDFGRLTAQHSPVSGVTRFRWDATDHLIERTDEGEVITRISRDSLGRAVRVRAGPEDGRIEWGTVNRPIRVVYAAGEERFDYDAQARLISHDLLVDGKDYRISYEFDALGRISRKHLPDGSVLRYRYNGPLHPKPGVLAGIDRQGIIDRPIISGLNSADERLNNRGFTFANGLTSRMVIDANGNVVSDGNSKVGQSRLTGTQTGSVEATYVRTARIGETPSADVTPPWTDRVVGRLTEFGAQSERSSTTAVIDKYFIGEPTYDARGQLVKDSQRRYEWDALGRLSRVLRSEDTGLIRASYTPPDAVRQRIAEYRYNLFGQRIAKLTYGAAGATATYFVWDGTELAAEVDQFGHVTRDYVYLEGRPIAMLVGRAIYSIHTDHRMAPIAVTDANRRVVWQADVHDNGAADIVSGSSIDLPLRASNQYFDSETGLHYNVYRYLDAERGRYLSPDPMGLAAGPDLYQFALGKPHSFVDPLGLQATTTNWATATYGAKLTEIIKRAIPMVPQEIGAALNKLIQPATLASMVLIMGVFAGLQASPIGWIADAGILAYSVWMFGSGLIVILKTLLQLNTDTKNAKCDPDLTAAAKRLAAGFVTGSGDVVGGLAGVWGVKSSGGLTRIANGVTTLVDYAKSALGIAEEGADVVLQGAAGAAPGVAPLTPGLGGTVSNSVAKIPWTTTVQGIARQGLAFEDYVATFRAAVDRLPPNFKTFDFYNRVTKVATSVKTMNTQAAGYLSNPSAIYSSLTKYLNAMDTFQTYRLSGVTLNNAQIATKEMQLAVPASTTAAQWAQINRAIAYASSKGMKLIVTVIN